MNDMQKRQTRIFGTQSDGTLVRCRALPENRGKGNCPHEGDHIELSIEKLQTGFLAKHNEEALAKYFGEFPDLQPTSGLQKSKENKESKVVETDPSIMNLKGKARRIDMIARGRKEAEKFTQEHYDFSKKVHSHIKEFLPTIDKSIENNKDNVDALSSFLKSDDAFAVEMRSFLGDDVDVDNFSEVLVNPPQSMKLKVSWRKSHNSCKRAVLTSLNNNMSQENYVTSVAFFKGKCCYCNCNLRKDSNAKSNATGEHLTPVAQSKRNKVSGGTRFGNMALACSKCNTRRGNYETEIWLNQMDYMSHEKKAFALGQIEAFRNFVGYKEYSEDDSEKILSKIKQIDLLIKKKKESQDEPLSSEQGDALKEIIKKNVRSLENEVSVGKSQ